METTGRIASERHELGRHIRAAREDLGLSQNRVADRAGISRTYYVDVEQGRRNVTIDNVLKIAGALGVPLSRLAYGIEDRA